MASKTEIADFEYFDEYFPDPYEYDELDDVSPLMICPGARGWEKACSVYPFYLFHLAKGRKDH
jgi:hypothetical protein